MICSGCSNSSARITRTYFDSHVGWVEICDSKDCGDLRQPSLPDTYFRQPYHDEHLDTFIESKRHKQAVMKRQDVHEDGDRFHGALEKGIREVKKKPRLSNEFKKKLAMSARVSVKKVIGSRA